MRHIIKYTLVVLGTISVAVLFYQFQVVLLLLVASLAVTAASRPLLDYLGRLRMPGFMAQLLILILVLSAIIGVIVLMSPLLGAEMQLLTDQSILQYSSAYRTWENGPAWQQTIASRLPEPSRLADNFIGTNGELLLPAAINLTQDLATFFTNFFILLTFSLYWAQDRNRFIHVWLSFLPPYRRTPVRNAWLATEQAVGSYLRHELVLSLTAALILGIGYALLDLPYHITLALLVFIGWFIPLLGLAVILIPVFLTALGSGWAIVLISIAYTLLVLMGLKYWFEPKYLHPRRYSSFLIVFWILVLGSTLGLGGYLAGPVVAVASQTLWDQYLKNPSRRELEEIDLADLRQRYAEVYGKYNDIDEADRSPQLKSLIDRLERTLNDMESLAEKPYSKI
jgi:predicted PurR-regulated permease PerM